MSFGEVVHVPLQDYILNKDTKTNMTNSYQIYN